MFTLTDAGLRRLCTINAFPIPADELVFFGLRGCLPVQEDSTEFRAEHVLELSDPNYLNPRCTLGQWWPKDGTFALFPGSTVPHHKYVKTALAKGGAGANQLMAGRYTDYRKGVHCQGKSTAHDAFRQTQGRPVRRTADDLVFDNEDRVEITNPCDNLHAAWCMGVDRNYDSAGCQVVIGYPKCQKRQGEPDAGPWKSFKENAYALPQTTFTYILLTGRDAQQVALAGTAKLSVRLRYGSKGGVVSALQDALKKTGAYNGNEGDDFGSQTLEAVLKYQTAKFGADADDGIVGPITASALGLTLPRL